MSIFNLHSIKYTQHGVLPATILLIFSCSSPREKQFFNRLNAWEKIRFAAQEKRVDDLLRISMDTLSCIECNEGESRIDKEAFFRYYINQIEISGEKEYTIYSEPYEEIAGFSTRHRITYHYNGGHEGGSHSKVYTLLTGKKGVLFQGVFSVP